MAESEHIQYMGIAIGAHGGILGSTTGLQNLGIGHRGISLMARMAIEGSVWIIRRFRP